MERTLELTAEKRTRENRRSPAWPGLSSALCLVLLCLSACAETGQVDPTYKAVFLDDGRALFGKMAHAGPTEVSLRDVIYIEAASGQEQNASLCRHNTVRIPVDRIVTVIDTDYRAVYFDDGRGLFGKLEEAGPNHVLLGDVHTIRARAVGGTDEPRVFIERPVRWHRPERLYVDTLHIEAIEPSAGAGRVLFPESPKKARSGRSLEKKLEGR